jgi:tetratricopeptide (TPR) repeat protein
VAALLYHLAMARADQGDQASADETAAEASKTIAGKTRWLLDAHLDAAFALERRGRFPWAEREYRQVVDADSPEWAARARLALSEMLHDQGDDLRAAEVLDGLARLEDQPLGLVLRRLSQTAGFERTVGAVRARTHYFYACHWHKHGDVAQQRKSLDQAVQHDPAELDALIARYQLPNLEPEHRQKTLQMIREVADGLRQNIRKSPNTPRYYNEFAWLIANTQGDFDEALRYARKAVELRPNRGDYLDTLAHVHFARGDLENAVKCENQAAQFEPHSGLILHKLEVFRHALQEKSRDAKQKPHKRPDQQKGTQDEAARSQRD